jgi:hypothetical protein
VTQITNSETYFRNKECPFTELFSLLKRYEVSSVQVPAMAYETEELKAMNQHVENAITFLLQGLQDLGSLMERVAVNRKVRNDVVGIGYFISFISNLTEALNILRSDNEHELKRRQVMD